MGILRKRVNWVLDADIRGFFDNMSHEWTMKFVEHRVADQRILRLIQKWLKAGVSEDGQWSETKVGTPQGAVVSPLLANVYLHYVFDLWVEVWRKKVAHGRCHGRAICGRLCATSAKGRGGPNVCNCLIDEGRPLGTGLQEQVPNHLRRLWSKAMVVSTEGKGLGRTRSGDWQEEDRKGTTDDVSKA